MKKTVVSFVSFLAAAALACHLLAAGSFAAADSVAAAGSAGRLIAVSLAELDCAEGADGYSKYGDWYGIAHGDWCDMFVSWCAEQAGIPASVFPRSASCTAHMNNFLRMGRYHDSAARGGDYVPAPGDLVFFYNPVKYPAGTVLRHVGIVLCVENGHVFSIEGNTLTNRLDDPVYYENAAPADGEDRTPDDYVAVKHYPLDAECIHGYAAPDYETRAVYLPDGFVDLGAYEPLRAVFDTLDASGVMPGTSRYTFSPRYGVTRSEFLQAVTGLFAISDWDASSAAFDDVPADSACYDAVMAARAAGIVYGDGGNAFSPERYISPEEAQTVLSRTLRYVGLEDRVFAFSEGDFSYPPSLYTTRADVAQALYELLCELPASGEGDASALPTDGEADGGAPASGEDRSDAAATIPVTGK